MLKLNLKRLCLSGVSILISLFLSEIILRIFGIGYGVFPLRPDSILHHVHPKDYRFLSFDPNGEFGGFNVYFDENGLVADPKSSLKSDKAATVKNKKICLMGDSFTEGIQVPYEKSFAGRIAKNLSQWEVLNFGVSSYSPIFYLVQWREIIKKHKPNVVILQLYNNDIPTDLKYFNSKRVKKSGNKIIALFDNENRFKNFLKRSYLIRFIRKCEIQLNHFFKKENSSTDIFNPELTALSKDFIIKLNKEINDSGSIFILTAVPPKKINNKSHHEKWREFCELNKIIFMDLATDFEVFQGKGDKLFYDIDIHFNDLGHKVVSKKILKTISEIELALP